jgi:hypothetical protein
MVHDGVGVQRLDISNLKMHIKFEILGALLEDWETESENQRS